MSLTNIISGSAFKSIFAALILFWTLLVVAGSFLILAVDNTLSEELQFQTAAELLMLEEIYQAQGLEAFVSTLRSLENDYHAAERSYGLLDKNRVKLVGSFSLLPDYVGVVDTPASGNALHETRGKFIVTFKNMDDFTLIVGRNSRILKQAKDRLLASLLIIGGLFSFLAAWLGWKYSTQSDRKLSNMEMALARVSQGHMEARIEEGPGNGQIDRVIKQVNLHLARLDSLITSIKATAAAIAHDLKTPLSRTQISIHQAIDAIESKDDPDPYLTSALSETENLNLVFDTVLRISRLQTGQGSPENFVKCNLVDIATQVIEFLEPLAMGNNQTLIHDVSDGAITLADKSMIQQLIMNLVSNSIHYAGENAAIRIRSENKNDFIELSVSDNGPGVSEAQIEKIVAPFHRGDPSRSDAGNGLGLAMADAVARFHNTTLQLENTYPGFTASITLPKL